LLSSLQHLPNPIARPRNPTISLMKAPAKIALAILALSVVHPAWPGTSSAAARKTWSLTMPAANFDRSALTDPGDAQKIRAAGTLGGSRHDWGITGWVEYEFDVPDSGWYEIYALKSAAGTQFIFDPDAGDDGQFAFYGGRGVVGDEEKVGNAWLQSGRHRLRIQHYYWTGFPRSGGFVLRAASDQPDKSVYASLGPSAPIYRKGECPTLQLRAGGLESVVKITVWTKDGSSRLLRSDSLDFSAGSSAPRQVLPLLCDEEGLFNLTFGIGGHEIPQRDLPSLTYEVIDTATPSMPATQRKTLVEEIDLTLTAPDYFAGGQTRVVRTAAGSYRESGDTGFTRFQRAPAVARPLLAEPSWFAYRLRNVVAQKPYMVEVDYPDDRLRTFAIALRERAPLSYPVAGGVDSGGEFTLANKMLTQSLLFWPRAPGTRVTLLNAHDGRRAAAAKIRVYRLDDTLAPLVPEGTAGRHFLNWYEEGSNFLSMYGAPDDSATGLHIAAGRWAQAVRNMGGTVLAPTVLVYSFALYPSRYNLAFSRPDLDYLQRILLTAEKHGLKVLPELHPRADELSWPYAGLPDPKPNLLVSKDGLTNFYQNDGETRIYPPLYNPLFPANQDWYVEMIGELADRYANSPALLGVNLRLMQWANAALNNFHSLDWGYDDFTVELFKTETASSLPLGRADDNSRFASRYAWLMKNARTQWIEWRCRKIADLYARIRDRVRRARPDLKVYSSVFEWELSNAPMDALRGAGIDPAMLRNITGIELVNSMHAYGRSEAAALATQPARDRLLDVRNLHLLSAGKTPGRFLTGAKYLEITDAVAPPDLLGFDSETKRTWTSAVTDPAGRHVLERFAVELAETDATLLGDGGNAYSLGQPILREFLQEYVRLPAEAFSQRDDAHDPVAVWERRQADSFVYYAVNRERYPVQVDISLTARAKPVRLIDGSPVSLRDNRMHVELKPYQLIAYKAQKSTRILRIGTRVSAGDRQRVTAQVAWLQSLASARDDKRVWGLDDGEKKLLHASATEAAAALARGHLWRARTLIEHHDLLEIYGKLKRYPPHLRDIAVDE
jgi:hypothetical protein